MAHPKQFNKPLKNETIMVEDFSNWGANLRQDALVSVLKGQICQPLTVHNHLLPVNKFKMTNLNLKALVTRLLPVG